jgi:aminoglycoside phosphotransferase
MPLPPPTFDTVDAYAARLGDSAFWTPYVQELVARHGLPLAPPTVGTIGSFPTFLVGQHVVKLYGERFDGAICFETERTALRLLADHPAITAPALVADGMLFGTDSTHGNDWPWPYLVMTRLPGTAWHEANLDEAERHPLAHQIGTSIRRLHDLPPPTGPFWDRDWLAEFQATCVERQRRYGHLPDHLIEQIDAYLLPPLPDRRLTHADLHDHHILVDGLELLGILDWGDAVVADRHYELPALHLHTFNADRRLLASFLDGYGWPPTNDFARRAMSMTLIYPFSVLDRVARRHNLAQIPTLEALADLIWG